MRKTLIIHNPRAGQKKNIVLRDELPWLIPSGLNYDYVETQYAGHATELAQDAIAKGYACVAAAGGDGTVNEIASALVGTDCALAIIPMGSGNGLARHNHIPMDLKKAFDVLLTGHPFQMDSGRINDHFFFCAAGIGFDALVSQKFATSKRRGLISYFLIAIQEYIAYKSKTYDLYMDGRHLSRTCFFITFANANQFGNHAYIAPQAAINDGEIEVCLVKPFRWWRGFKLAYRLFKGTIESSFLYESFSAKEIRVTHADNVPFHFDGEAWPNPTNEVRIQIRPSSLSLIVPS